MGVSPWGVLLHYLLHRLHGIVDCNQNPPKKSPPDAPTWDPQCPPRTPLALAFLHLLFPSWPNPFKWRHETLQAQILGCISNDQAMVSCGGNWIRICERCRKSKFDMAHAAGLLTAFSFAQAESPDMLKERHTKPWSCMILPYLIRILFDVFILTNPPGFCGWFVVTVVTVDITPLGQALPHPRHSIRLSLAMHQTA